MILQIDTEKVQKLGLNETVVLAYLKLHKADKGEMTRIELPVMLELLQIKTTKIKNIMRILWFTQEVKYFDFYGFHTLTYEID